MWTNHYSSHPTPTCLWTREQDQHPLQDLVLAAWLVSANSSRQTTFRTKLKPFSCPLGVNPQQPVMTAWKQWVSWCLSKQVNPVSAPLNAIIEYLTHLFHLGREYRTINLHRSAISKTHPPIDSVRVGEHPLICQLLIKGVFQFKSPLPRYANSWEVGKVQAHDLRFRKFLPEGVVFNLPELTKVVRLGQPLKVSFHPAFAEVKAFMPSGI